MNPAIFKYCDGKRNKIHYPKSVNYDKNCDATVVYNLLIQYRKDQRPINFSIADESWHRWQIK